MQRRIKFMYFSNVMISNLIEDVKFCEYCTTQMHIYCTYFVYVNNVITAFTDLDQINTRKTAFILKNCQLNSRRFSFNLMAEISSHFS